MSTEAALLRAIRDQPDEDTPRLVYADFIEEDGHSARAEFIRLQVERARLPDGAPQRGPLEDREHELLGEHECDWLGVPPDDTAELTEWEFERGFVHEVAASPVFMNGPGADLCAAHPVRRWRVTSGDLDTNFPADLREAGQRGWFARLEAVDLTGWYPDLGEISGFLARSAFDRLCELDLTGRGPLEPLPEVLEFAPFRDRLKALRCGAAGYEGGRLDAAEFARAMGSACRLDEFAAVAAQLTADDLRDLLPAPALMALTALDVRDNPIAADGWEAFRAAAFRLRELDISGTQLGGALGRLLGCAALRDLRRLHTNRAGLAARDVEELAASRFWSQAEELRLQQGAWANNNDYDENGRPANQAAAVSLQTLFSNPGPSHLRVLDIAGNAMRDTGVARLCAAPWIESLTYLDLSQNYLSDESLRNIAGSGRFARLHTLHLNGNSVYQQADAEPGDSITDAGLRALAECPTLANLRVLSLSGTRITAAGIEALLNSPHWRLSGLRLSHCQLRPDAVEVLAAAPQLARLQVLDIGTNDDIRVSDLAPLAESEYLSPQTELDIRGLYAGDSEVRSALADRLGRRLSS
ncbi:TIGR02996 domain-containing protein [Gemmata sp. JC717]|uniref:TIGR02996 domain-containing protein n=1 Tax=Gemmata algarum TaxID=2975278 RepID=UPI0021BB8F98|nr:TIGR02996 domain-containing protein [Gemmata algarum]MDY3554999.1 TIGR02996 domain-containing protein [Gemmata algarum]